MDINILQSKMTREFKQMFQGFCQNNEMRQLTPQLSQEFIKTTKRALAVIGMTAIKEFIESYDSEASSILKDQKIFRYKFDSSRRYLTIFGEIKINRRIYQADKGGKCYIPLDEYWCMENEYATLDVKESLLYSSAQNTPTETESLLKKCSLFNPSATTIKRIITKEGSLFKQHRSEIKEYIHNNETIPDATDIIVCSMDGVNLLLKEKGKAKGRPVQRPKKAKSESGTTSYKNAMVGSFSFYQRIENERPKRLCSIYESGMPEEKALEFKKRFEKEVVAIEHKTSNKNVDKIMLCDGARGLWKYIDHNEFYKDFDTLVDFYHTIEYLSKASEAIFGKGNYGGLQWYNKWRSKLLEEDDCVNAIIRSIKYYRDSYKLSKNQKDVIKSTLTFFRNNKSRMLYANFIQRGLPIGSGPVEAACKTIVKQRMCRSGMRWSRTGGENVLQFRTIVKSNRWETYWEWYKKYKKVA